MKHNLLKKTILIAASLFTAGSASAIGLDNLGIANHLGVGLSVSTNGIGLEAATPITRWVEARVGASVMPGFSFKTDADVQYRLQGDSRTATMDLKGSFRRWQGSVIFNVYPFPVGSFYVAAGAYFGGSEILKISGHTDEISKLQAEYPTVSVGDYEIPIDENGNARGALKVQSFRPYLGIGWGRAVPKRRINFGVELGVQFHGKPKVYSSEGEVKLGEIDGSDDFQDIIDHVKVWPVLKFTISGKIF